MSNMNFKMGDHIFRAEFSFDEISNSISLPLYKVKSDSQPIRHLAEECVKVLEGETIPQCLDYMEKTRVWNMVQSDSRQFEDRLLLVARLIHHPESFLKWPSQEVFNSIVVEKKWEFRTSTEKMRVLNSLRNYLGSIAGAKAIVESVVLAADELFTNAIYNAPFVDANYTLDRATVVVLDSEKSAQLLIAHDHERIFLACLDEFGTLNCEALIKTVQNCLKIGVSKSINLDVGGAGIGIFRVVDLSSEFFAVVEKENRTLVGCSFLLGKSSKQIRLSPKSFYFQIFQNIEFNSSKVRLERRGNNLLLRFIGNFTEPWTLDQLDLDGVDEISLDLRQMESSNLNFLAQNLKFFQKLKNLKCVYLEYLKTANLDEALQIIEEVPFSIEIRSLYVPISCPKGHLTKKVPFFRSLEKIEFDRNFKVPQCPKCNDTMVIVESTKRIIAKADRS